MTTGTKVALGIAGVACMAAGVFAWALIDLCSQLDKFDEDFGSERSRRRYPYAEDEFDEGDGCCCYECYDEY